jgi:hypothetical protein
MSRRSDYAKRRRLQQFTIEASRVMLGGDRCCGCTEVSVGIVADVKHTGLDRAADAVVYRPFGNNRTARRSWSAKDVCQSPGCCGSASSLFGGKCENP